MKKNKTLQFGIIGSATVLEYGFMPSINLTGGVEASAIASRSMEKARLTAAKYGIPKAYGSYNDLLKDKDIDCIYVALPNSMHMDWAKKSLKAGKHVLCEKPAAFNAKEISSALGIIKEKKLIFAEAFQYRYHPLMLKVRDLVRAGDIGELLNIESSYCEIIENRKAAQFRTDMAGGAVMDEGCYCVDFARFIAGCDDAEILNVKSKMVTGVDGETRADLRFSNGVAATVICSIIRTTPAYALIVGSKGTIFIHNPFPTALMVNGKVTDMYLCLLQKGAKIRDIKVPTKLTYACQMEAFRDAVLSGRQPLVDAESALANMKIVDAIRTKAGVPIAKPK